MITVLFTVNIDLKPARIFFPRIASRWISNNIAFILSFFRNVVSESNQIDSLKNVQDDTKTLYVFVRTKLYSRSNKFSFSQALFQITYQLTVCTKYKTYTLVKMSKLQSKTMNSF